MWISCTKGLILNVSLAERIYVDAVDGCDRFKLTAVYPHSNHMYFYYCDTRKEAEVELARILTLLNT